jgi:hypothetical protein
MLVVVLCVHARHFTDQLMFFFLNFNWLDHFITAVLITFLPHPMLNGVMLCYFFLFIIYDYFIINYLYHKNKRKWWYVSSPDFIFWCIDWFWRFVKWNFMKLSQQFSLVYVWKLFSNSLKLFIFTNFPPFAWYLIMLQLEQF